MEEITKQSWFHLSTGQFGYPQPEEGYLDISYDMSAACKTCKIGKKQKSEFRFRSQPKAKHSQFLGLNWIFDEIFVREEAKEILETNNITGLTFSKPVINKNSIPIEGIYQLHVDTFISNGLITENLNVEICEMPRNEASLKFLTAIKSNLVVGPFCGNLKYNFPQGDNCIKIDGIFLENKPDFVRLNYWFGSGGSSNQPILVSSKVKDLIKKEKLRGAYFDLIEVL